MTIAVTGATGYVGRAFVDRCLAAGAGVRALVRDPQAALPGGVERAVVDLVAPAGSPAPPWRRCARPLVVEQPPSRAPPGGERRRHAGRDRRHRRGVRASST
jgi:nucleoside-diphosphate-sugar epimerase